MSPNYNVYRALYPRVINMKFTNPVIGQRLRTDNGPTLIVYGHSAPCVQQLGQLSRNEIISPDVTEGEKMRQRESSRAQRQGAVKVERDASKRKNEREILRNLDWCHVALGDLKVRDGRNGERVQKKIDIDREKGREGERREHAVTARFEAA